MSCRAAMQPNERSCMDRTGTGRVRTGPYGLFALPSSSLAACLWDCGRQVTGE